MNLKNLGNDAAGNFPLAREPSVYTLKLEEFMRSMGGSGKDFGSMNMDELVKSIWTAEEVQTMAFTGGGQQGTGTGTGTPGPGGGGAHLQRQGSLTLPRTLSEKTVDEVWKDISKDYVTGKDGSGTGTGGANLAKTERQQTLGEMTLEEFLARAGVVREDTQLGGKAKGGVLGDLGMGLEELNKGGGGLMGMGNRIFSGNNDPMTIGSHTNIPLNVNGVRSNQQPQVPNSQSPQPHRILPKQHAMTNYAAAAAQMPLTSNAQLGNQGIRGGTVGLVDQVEGLHGIGNMVTGSALQRGGMGMVGFSLAPGTGGGGIHVTNQMLSCDEIGKSNGDTSSVSPVPYAFNGDLRGRIRKSGGPREKVIERRQRRMIKNRESAARSRARKQAYTVELETEVAQLKEENEELQRKQAEIVEIQKNQIMEMMNLQRGVKKRCLSRAHTGPW